MVKDVVVPFPGRVGMFAIALSNFLRRILEGADPQHKGKGVPSNHHFQGRAVKLQGCSMTSDRTSSCFGIV